MSQTIPVFKVFMSPDVVGPVGEVLLSGYIGQGAQVERFEEKLADTLGNRRIVTVNSGTSGLHLALRLLRRPPDAAPHPGHAEDGDEILSTPVTCTATNWAILANNLKIRWADVDPMTGNIDPEDVRRKLSPRTKAIVAVHWGGYPCDLAALRSVQRECEERFGFRPPILEDCAHAWGSQYKGASIGNHGNLCVYSFQAIKTLTTGDGGCLVLPTKEMYRRARLLRWYGLDRDARKDFRCEQDVAEWGYKFHMNDINATIGLHNLPYMEGLIATQREHAAYYDAALADVKDLTLLEPSRTHTSAPPFTLSSYWLYTIRVKRRDAFMQAMNERGIMVSRVHDRNDKHTCVANFREPLPGTTEFCEEMVCIPCGWWVTPEDRKYIADTIREGW